jgi:hypothetical protein
MNKLTIQESELAYYPGAEKGIFCPRLTNCESKEKPTFCSCPLLAVRPDADARCQNCLSCCLDLKIRNKPDPSACRTGTHSDCYNAPDRNNRKLELLALSCLRKGDIKIPPVPADLLGTFDSSCEINVRALPLKNCHGALWRTSRSWEVYINARESPEEQRLTLFHEGFHILAYLNASPTLKKPGDHDCLYNELLAESFAHKLLMPRKWLERDWHESQDIAALSRKFQVTEKALFARLKEMHLTSD